jgi:DNA-binding PadR family transcriptional regulator
MVYSTMKELMDGDFVECRMEEHRGRRRRVCWLTPSGEESFRAAARVWQKMLPQVEATVAQALAEPAVNPTAASSCPQPSPIASQRRRAHRD